MYKVYSYSYSYPLSTSSLTTTVSDLVGDVLDTMGFLNQTTSTTYPSNSYIYVNLKDKDEKGSSPKAEILTFKQTIERIFKTFENKPFPKYEVLANEKTQEVILRMLLAGYSQENIEILEDPKENVVMVNISEATSNIPDGFDVVSGNIKKGKMAVGFSLPKYGMVDSAKFENGVLTIKIKVKVPESEAPKKIVLS